MMNTLTMHEPTDECAQNHCFSHHVDEPATTAPYIVCMECGHLYLTAADLRRAYRRRLRGDWGHPWMRPRLFAGISDGRFGDTLWSWLWRYATVRADRITFCQACSHDF